MKMETTTTRPRLLMLMLAAAVAVVCVFGVASSADAGQLLTSKNCSLGPGGECYTGYYTPGTTMYSRFDNDSGGSYNHCASVATSSNFYGNVCSTSQYAYSNCIALTTARGRGSTSSTHSYQLNFFKIC